jgi:diguanylate cyclase (GGDEF)-like protein
MHTASTARALADALSLAAERASGAQLALMFVERLDGSLEYVVPHSETRRREQARIIGAPPFAAKIDPAAVPALGEAIDSGAAVACKTGDLFASSGVLPDGHPGRDPAIAHARIAPIEAAGERVGALICLADRELDGEIVQLIAAHAGVAFRGIGASTTEVIAVDPARTIFDARKLGAELQRELARAQRYGRDVSICLVEATNLRLLRERFGTGLTADLFATLGETLARNARDVDIIGEYKDRGYCMVLAEATADGVEAAAERLASVANSAAQGQGTPGLELHLVVGVATAPIDGGLAEDLFAAAERRMYEDGARRVA